VSALQWVVDGCAIALASLMLAGGTIGDLHGHKRVILAGLGIFGVASLACGAAPSSGLLVGARVLQGVGAALLLPGTLVIISRAFPEPGEQAKAIGIWAGIGSLALPAGPLLGGALVDAFGWRAIFLVNVPIVVVALLVAVRVAGETDEPRQGRLDLAGPRRRPVPWPRSPSPMSRPAAAAWARRSWPRPRRRSPAWSAS
jgi:MFS transporter, DHA2 family, methylenomycin A resistance protein